MSGPSVITEGYLPSFFSIATLGYGTSANAPTPPPTPPDDTVVRYGPALTPAERRRWFGDFESPISRAARRKTKEYLQRVEFGILPPEVKEEILEKIEVKVVKTATVHAETKPKFNQERVVNDVVRQMKSEIRQVLEDRRIMLEEQSEEEDIVVIASYLLQ